MGQTTEIHLNDVRRAGAGMLAIAAVLPLLPAGAGVPCVLRAVTGIPCPFCGMTRAVVAAVHLDFPASLAFNPGGVVAVGIAIALLWRRRSRIAEIPSWVIPATLSVMWIYELFNYGVVG